MARVKVTAKFKILELVDKFVDDTTANAIGQTVVDEATRLISEGQSPVRGVGRFIGYSDSYKNWIKGEMKGRVSAARAIVKTKYASKSTKARAKIRTKAINEAKEAGKKVRPVNLNLSGKMMALFGYELRGQSIMVGFTKRGPHMDLPEYHQYGTDKMPARPMVPQEHEEWTITVMRAIRDAYGSRLEKLIRQSNKRE